MVKGGRGRVEKVEDLPISEDKGSELVYNRAKAVSIVTLQLFYSNLEEISKVLVVPVGGYKLLSQIGPENKGEDWPEVRLAGNRFSKSPSIHHKLTCIRGIPPETS